MAKRNLMDSLDNYWEEPGDSGLAKNIDPNRRYNSIELSQTLEYQRHYFLSSQSLRVAIRSKELPAIKVGGKVGIWSILGSDALLWIENYKSKRPAPNRAFVIDQWKGNLC